MCVSVYICESEVCVSVCVRMHAYVRECVRG